MHPNNRYRDIFQGNYSPFDVILGGQINDEAKLPCITVQNRYARHMMTSSNGNLFRVTGHFLWEIHRSPVNSPHKSQWREALLFSLICAWINGWVNTREAGDLRRNRAHYDVTIMNKSLPTRSHSMIPKNNYGCNIFNSINGSHFNLTIYFIQSAIISEFIVARTIWHLKVTFLNALCWLLFHLQWIFFSACVIDNE